MPYFFFQILLIFMGKTKNKNGVEEPPLITEQDRNTNPIFKIIYKRIRNLNKKLHNIDALSEQDPATLKPEQLKKIHTREEVIADIKKNEEFAHFYKEILIENDGLAFDNSEDIIKISTLLVVGQFIQKLGKKKLDKEMLRVFSGVYEPINQPASVETPIIERIGAIYDLLNGFLTNKNDYSACQDYISYLSEEMPQPEQPSESDSKPVQKQVKAPKAEEKKEPHEEKTAESKKEDKKKEEVKEQVEPVKQEENVVVKEEQKVVEEKEKEEEDWLSDKEENQPQPKTREEKAEKTEEKVHEQQKEVSSTQNENKPAKRSEKNRGNKTEWKKGDRYENKYEGKGNQYQERGNRYEKKGNHYDRKPRYEKNEHHERKVMYEEKKKPKDKPKNNSDTSLEPTPQKVRPQKPKYIEKK